jgi:hypothetical protein
LVKAMKLKEKAMPDTSKTGDRSSRRPIGAASRRGRAPSWLVGALLASAIAVAAVPASAQNSSVAEALFQEGKRMMAEGNYREACPKLAESHRMDPGAGTLTALALCHRAEGKTATAWSEFREVISLARRDNRKDREQVAQENIAELEPKLSRLRVIVEPSDAQKIEVRLDDATMTRAAFDQALPVDPGTRRIVASAPGKKTFETTVQIGSDHDEKTVTIPRLEEDPRAGTAISDRSGPSRAEPNSGEQRFVVPTVIALGIGLAGVGVGAGFGLKALDEQSTLDTACGPTKRCRPAQSDDISSLKTSSTISTIGFIAGGVGLVAATVLYLAGRPSSKEKVSGRAGIIPLVSGAGIGASF